MSRRVAIYCRGKAVRANLAAEEALRRLASRAGWALRHRVVMLLDLDVIIEAGPAFLPLGVGIGFGGQGPLIRNIGYFTAW